VPTWGSLLEIVFVIMGSLLDPDLDCV